MKRNEKKRKRKEKNGLNSKISINKYTYILL